jgi:hypothetical protein
VSGQRPREFEFAVRPDHCIRVNREVDRQLPDGWQLVPGANRPGGARGMHLIDDLAINRKAALQIELKAHCFYMY